MSWAFLAASAALAMSIGCTSYSVIPIDLRQLHDEGRGGVTISMEPSSKHNLGRVRANGRTWLFGQCTHAAQLAIDELAQQAKQRGSARVTQLRFRGKWRWVNEPLCRRNLTYAIFVFPLAFPFPTSVTVSGIAE